MEVITIINANIFCCENCLTSIFNKKDAQFYPPYTYAVKEKYTKNLCFGHYEELNCSTCFEGGICHSFTIHGERFFEFRQIVTFYEILEGVIARNLQIKDL